MEKFLNTMLNYDFSVVKFEIEEKFEKLFTGETKCKALGNKKKVNLNCKKSFLLSINKLN